MQEINGIDSSESNESVVILNVPPIGIDLRRIFIALRKDIPHKKLMFSSSSRADVFIPTLRQKFILIPHKEFLIVKASKKIKLPLVMDGVLLDMKIIDILVAWLEHLGINDKLKSELLPTDEYNDH